MKKFDPRVLPSAYLTDPQPGHAFVYVSTIQRMTIHLFGREAIMASGDEEVAEDASQLNIPIHAFDLIIADECHRGYSTQGSAICRILVPIEDSIHLQPEQGNCKSRSRNN